jgi:hypothetical protein
LFIKRDNETKSRVEREAFDDHEVGETERDRARESLLTVNENTCGFPVNFLFHASLRDEAQSLADCFGDALVQVIIHLQRQVLDSVLLIVVGVLMRNTVDDILYLMFDEEEMVLSLINSTQKDAFVNLDAGGGRLNC